MEGLNLLDITIRYFNVIVFVLCVLFGMISLFASWVAWREIHKKQNIIRSVIAAYNIAEDTLEKGRTPRGDYEFDPAIVQTVMNTLQEILNAVYGEVTGKPMPPREDRTHGSKRLAGLRNLGKALKRRPVEETMDAHTDVPALIPDRRGQEQSLPHS
jgi:hypothetical protein